MPTTFIWQSLSSMCPKRRSGQNQKAGFTEVALDQLGGGQGLQLRQYHIYHLFGKSIVLNMALERLLRSHPALGEDSDSDIEVPRFQSLDCAEDSDGDLEVEKN